MAKVRAASTSLSWKSCMELHELLSFSSAHLRKDTCKLVSDMYLRTWLKVESRSLRSSKSRTLRDKVADSLQKSEKREMVVQTHVAKLPLLPNKRLGGFSLQCVLYHSRCYEANQHIGPGSSNQVTLENVSKNVAALECVRHRPK
jgi:hypothetical protein